MKVTFHSNPIFSFPKRVYGDRSLPKDPWWPLQSLEATALWLLGVTGNTAIFIFSATQMLGSKLLSVCVCVCVCVRVTMQINK